jgi:hypothetical protein
MGAIPHRWANLASPRSRLEALAGDDEQQGGSGLDE